MADSNSISSRGRPQTRPRGLALCLMALVAFPLFQSPALAQGLNLTLATGDDYPPFTGTELPGGGMAMRLVIRAFEEANVTVREVEWLPWKRGYELTRMGRIDGTFPYGWTRERAAESLYSDPFFPIRDYAWVMRESPFDPQSMDGLRGRTFCRARGYGNFGMLAELIDQGAIRRETPSTMAKCFRMLAVGRVDFVSSASSDALNAIGEAGLARTGVVRRNLVLADLSLHFIIGKSHPRAREILDAFNRGLGVLRQSGEMERIAAEFNWQE